ncbi:MAG: hypothetical protein Q4P29_01385 [Tissierellia bacterium]|nr:hypothetical protein [Tissierellia bacterium]
MDKLDKKFYDADMKMSYFINKMADPYNINTLFPGIYKEDYPEHIYEKLKRFVSLSFFHINLYSKDFQDLNPDIVSKRHSLAINYSNFDIMDFMNASYMTILEIKRVNGHIYAEDMITKDIYYIRNKESVGESDYLLANLIIVPDSFKKDKSILQGERHAYIYSFTFDLQKNLANDILALLNMEIPALKNDIGYDEKINLLLKHSYEFLYIASLFIKKFYQHMIDEVEIDPITAIKTLTSPIPNRHSEAFIEYVLAETKRERSLFFVYNMADIFGFHADDFSDHKDWIKHFEQIIMDGQLLFVNMIEETADILRIYIDFLKKYNHDATEYKKLYSHIMDNIFIYKSNFQKLEILQLDQYLSSEINQVIDLDSYYFPGLMMLDVMINLVMLGDYKITQVQRKASKITTNIIAEEIIYLSLDDKELGDMKKLPGLSYLHNFLVAHNLVTIHNNRFYLMPRGFQFLCLSDAEKLSFLIQSFFHPISYDGYGELIESSIDLVEEFKEIFLNLDTVNLNSKNRKYLEMLTLIDLGPLNSYEYINEGYQYYKEENIENLKDTIDFYFFNKTPHN